MKHKKSKTVETQDSGKLASMTNSATFVRLDQAEMVEYIDYFLAHGLLDEAIAKQRRLPPPVNEEQAGVYAHVRARIAEHLARQGHVTGAFDLLQPYDTALSRARLPAKERAQVCLQLGEAYCAISNYPSSVALLDEAIRYSLLAGEKHLEAIAHSQLGLVYCYLGEYVIAQDQLRQALKFLSKTSDKHSQAQVYRYFGQVYLGLGDFNSAIEHYNKSIFWANEAKAEPLLIEAKIQLGQAFLFQGKPRQAIHLYEEAIDCAQRSRPELLIQLYNNLAYSFILSGSWPRAEQLLSKNIALCHQNRDELNEALALAQFGLVYLLTGRIDEAKPTLNFALELSRQINSRVCESFAAINLGRLYLFLTDKAQANYYIQLGLDVARTINRQDYVIEAHLLLCELSLAQQDLVQAENYLEGVRKLIDNYANYRLKGQLLWAEAQLLMATNQNGVAKLTAAIEIFEVFSLPLEKANCLLARALSLKSQPNGFEKSIFDLERALTIAEKLGAIVLIQQIHVYLPSFQAEKRRAKTLSANIFQAQLLVERQQIYQLIQACSSRESVLQAAATLLAEQLQADTIFIYEVESDTRLKLLLSTKEASLLKDPLAIWLPSLIAEEQQGWVGERSLGDSFYVVLHTSVSGLQFALVVWGAPQSLVNNELVEAFFALTVELTALATKQRQPLEISSIDSDRLKSFKGLPEFTYASRKMIELAEQILRIHSSDLTVLITGESGTGKDLVARAIHSVSQRASRPFLPFNCTATPQEIVESQLFGYRKGAFTGANFDYEGVIRAADGGTLLLDEIGDLPLNIQPKLLRFLQEGEIQPLGLARPIKVNVRVIASTNRDLERMVERGEFREDLYHRLNIIRLGVASLRHRREEITPLAQYFLKQTCQRTGKSLVFSTEAMLLLGAYDWPGNVRQLKNEIERIVAFANEGDTIEKFHLSPEIVQTARLKVSTNQDKVDISLPTGGTLDEMIATTEKQIITRVLKQSRGNMRRAALTLGISRKGLYDKVKRLKIRQAE